MRMIDRQIEQFLTNCQIKQLSKKTMKAYSQALGRDGLRENG